MKKSIIAIGLGILVLGCTGPTAGRQAKPVEATATPQANLAAAAQVTLVNGELRFVVIDFREQSMPAVGATVELVRGDAKVATVRLTEPARGRFITADILEGEPRVGDRAR